MNPQYYNLKPGSVFCAYWERCVGCWELRLGWSIQNGPSAGIGTALKLQFHDEVTPWEEAMSDRYKFEDEREQGHAECAADQALRLSPEQRDRLWLILRDEVGPEPALRVLKRLESEV